MSHETYEDKDTPRAQSDLWKKTCPFAIPPTANAEGYRNRLKRIPEIYRFTEACLLAEPAHTLFEDIVSGRRHVNGDSLILAGSTGKGKSRVAAALAMVIASRGIWPVWLNAGEIRSAAFADWGAADKLIKENSRTKFLFIDDLGRGAPSAQTDEIIFQVIDNRITSRLPTIITTMETGETLPERFKDQRTAEAVVRRLREFYKGISFEHKP